MKKSNIIILLMLSFVLTTCIAILIILKHNRSELNDKFYSQNEFALPNFTVVVGEPFSKFEIRSGDSNKLIVKYNGITDIRTECVKVKNDTLYFSKLEKYDNRKKYIVECKNVKSINLMKNSHCWVVGLTSKILNVIINEGQFLINEQPILESGKIFWCKVKQLNISANKGVILFKNTITENANIQLNNTNCLFFNETYIHNLNLQLTDSSSIKNFYGNICNTNIEADGTSTLEVVKR